MSKIVEETFVSLTLRPDQWKLIDGVKIRNVSNRNKQITLTILNLDKDKRINNTWPKKKKDKE